MRYRFLLILWLTATLSFAQKQENHNSNISRNLDTFIDIYRQVDLLYVDSLNADTIMQWGINSMLQRIDPYTAYYPQEDDELMAMAQGKYAGIGSIIRFHKKEDRCVISEPYRDTPSDKAGLRPGDVILSIDDKDIKGMPVSTVSDMLRGEAGTTFKLKVRRPLLEDKSQESTHTITRQTISIPHLPYYGCVREGIGYLYLTGFNEGDAQRVRAALIEMKEQGAKSLVLDLRGNPGGVLDESVDIAGLFLPKGTKIVYTRGKTESATRSYYTRQEPVDTMMPIVAIVDGGSASAAEILSGSLQDLDRAVVMGARTFGKGLVQSIRDLPYGGNLKITTARYYIPSGRCIQARDYRHLNPDGSAKSLPDSLTTAFKTLHGREVRDGGGILPDIVITADTLPTIVIDLATSDALFDFSTLYALRHPTIAPAGTFRLTDEDYNAFVDFIVGQGFSYNRRSGEMLRMLRDMAKREGYLEAAKPELDALEEKFKGDLREDLMRFRDDIEPYICDDIVRRYYYEWGGCRQMLERDKCFERAVEILSDPAAYRSCLKF
ncbi:MAG: S41 family peptidase [Bacteroidales bacterium]|nr:S41 family peptidase [Candidatus Physcousia equi]